MERERRKSSACSRSFLAGLPAIVVTVSAPQTFQRVVQAFNEAGIRFMLTGSFASAYYGASRATQDIDFVIAPTLTQLTTFIHHLSPENYYVDMQSAVHASEKESMFNILDMQTGWKIDLIIRKSRAFSQEEFRRRVSVTVEGVPLFLATAEDVIVSKLEWAKLGQSVRQIRDVAQILKLRWNSLDRDYMQQWINDLDLSSEWNDACQESRVAGPDAG
jgi:hypothetical protein